jgi:uncharacterized Zn-binding protein involved in type VI secretion
MPPQARVGDNGQVTACAHGCPACPHPMIMGPAIIGAANVIVNGMPALRLGDTGVHAACCLTQMWIATKGSSTVFINNLPAMRIGDGLQHCGVAKGQIIAGSPNVTTGG